jgi:hypothetical protein
MSSLIKITMKSIGKEPQEWARELDQDFHFELQNQIKILGEKTSELMQQTIKSKTKRDGSTGKLAEAMKSNFFKEANHCEFWIGDVDYLNAEVKYWYWQNYGYAQTGRTTPPPNKGYFGEGNPPRLYGGKEKWTHTGDKNDWLLIPQRPLEPMDYIEAGIHETEINIPIMLAHIEKLLEG